jgi:hypothetical protein
VPWVRIHEGAIRHPKIVGLIDWRNPFCLWVWGLSYVQEHLTDGVIVKAAIPHPLALKTAQALIAHHLWSEAKDAFVVHDYLDWNDSRDVVRRKRAGGRARVAAHRNAGGNALRNGVTNAGSNALGNAHTPSGVSVVLRPDLAIIKTSEGESEGKPPARPMQVGRLFLHRWQTESLIATLGPFAEDFDLDLWLDALSHTFAAQALPRDVWKFVQAELHAEIARRGLAVAGAGLAPGGRAEPFACPHDPECHGRAACLLKTQLDALKANGGRG